VERDNDLRTKYLELITVWNAWSAMRPPSDNEEDDEAADSDDSD
jgi:hypothetical protein